MTEAANSAAIAVTLRVGPIQYSPPPAAALDGCNVNDPAIVSTMAFSPAEVTIAYTEGSLVEQITIEPHYFLSGDDWQGWAAFDVHGRWQCQVDYGPLYLEFSAHSFENFPVWIMSQVLSNASPRVSTAEANSWQFPYLAITMSGALSPNVTTSGPDAERCGGQDVLMVYGHSCP